jgi:hypothetical protein
VVSRPLPAAPLVVRRRYLTVAPRPLPAAPLVARRRYLAVVARTLPRFASQVLDQGARAVVCGAARCASQVLDRGAQAASRNAVAAAGDEQLGRCAAEQSKFYRLYLRSGKVTYAAIYLRRVRFAGVALRRR